MYTKIDTPGQDVSIYSTNLLKQTPLIQEVLLSKDPFHHLDHDHHQHYHCRYHYHDREQEYRLHYYRIH